MLTQIANVKIKIANSEKYASYGNLPLPFLNYYSLGLLFSAGTKTAAATVVVHKPFLSPAAD
jgi:hypothetical protein